MRRPVLVPNFHQMAVVRLESGVQVVLPSPFLRNPSQQTNSPQLPSAHAGILPLVSIAPISHRVNGQRRQ